MKIVIEDGFSKIKKTGIGQYTLIIEKLLGELNINVVNIEKPFLSKLKNKIFRRILYNLWLNTIFLFKLIQINDDITVICTNYAIPIIKVKRVKFVPVIHDLCAFKYPECSSKIINYYEKSNIKNSIKKADKIVTVSNTIKNEIIETFNYPKEKIYIVNSSLIAGLTEVENIDSTTVLNKYNIKNKQYILSVATNNKRKNINMLVKAYKYINEKYVDIKLVLVGNDYTLTFDNSNIIITGYIPDAELKVLYQNSLMYVFPSLYEGFGIPIIEAQYFGIPVICSDIPVFREIGKESVLFSKLNPMELNQNIIKLLNSAELINDFVKKGNNNINRFTREQICKQICSLIAKT